MFALAKLTFPELLGFVNGLSKQSFFYPNKLLENVLFKRTSQGFVSGTPPPQVARIGENLKFLLSLLPLILTEGNRKHCIDMAEHCISSDDLTPFQDFLFGQRPFQKLNTNKLKFAMAFREQERKKQQRTICNGVCISTQAHVYDM